MPRLAILAQMIGLSSDVIAAFEGKVFLDVIFFRVFVKHCISSLQLSKQKRLANTLAVTRSLSFKGVL